MSNYSQTTFFTPKDSLPPTNPAKTIFGAAYDVEFGNISTAISSKADAVSAISSILGTANEIAVSTTAGVATLSFSPNVVIPAPATGDALDVHGGVGNFASQIFGNASSGNSFGLNVQAGTTAADESFLVLNQAASAIFFRIFGDGHGSVGPSASSGVQWTAAGNVTVAPPSSGIGLTVGTSTTGVQNAQIGLTTFGVGVTFIANQAEIFSSSTTSLNIGAAGAAALNLYTSATNRLGIASGGNITITAPASGAALAVNGVSGVNIPVASFTGGSTAGQSNGVFVFAGTGNTSDRSLDILTQNGATRLFGVFGDGSVVVGAPTGGLQGAGSINAVSLFINGGQLFFGAPPSANSTAAPSDVGKMLVAAGNIAVNSATFLQGNIVSIYNATLGNITINGTIATMRLAGTATTGNRTLASKGIATLWFNGSSEVIVSGPGVS